MVQLAPGEGKTLTLALVASVWGWHGHPCHVITANDYLAESDADLLSRFYEAQGLRVGAVKQDQDPAQKKQIYHLDLVYGTAKQMLADYLSDIISFEGLASRQRVNLKRVQGKEGAFVMRGLHSVIVDEADSILIDDATTPLIISYPEPNPLLNEAVIKTRDFVDTIEPSLHYRLDDEDWEVRFTDQGYDAMESFMPGLPKLWHNWQRLEDLVIQAILAKEKFKLDEHFVILDEKIVLVDESTGRLMHGRSWSYGLQQAVEARAGLEMTSPSKTLDKMSFQSFFQSYHRLTGASGTLQDIQQELYQTYRLHTLEMPTRKASQLRFHSYRFFKQDSEKYRFLINKVADLVENGRAVLIGTRSVKQSEELSEQLKQQGLSFDVLNAKQLELEADIIEKAGCSRKITVATNMAGRGTDIHVEQDVLSLGGLCVIMFEPHESSRTDWQLFGRAGRHGHPGEAMALVAYEDSIFKNHSPVWLKPLLWYSPLWQSSVKVTRFLVSICQQNAQRKAFKKRKYLLKLDNLSQERMSFVKNKTRLSRD
jgi:preprotein translocase subunit SecA